MLPSRFTDNYDLPGRMDAMSSPGKTVAIIGGGPVRLAAAAHALGRGLNPIVLEAGDAVGHAVRKWSHVRMFSPWSYNVDKAAEPCCGKRAGTARSRTDIRRGASLSRSISNLSPSERNSASTYKPACGLFPWARGNRQGQDSGPGKRAFRNSLSER
jgi:glycine/D-amino acid oxidase-like deaminating enzyme